MDIQAYISSGIIESYVLGITTDAEAKELQTLAAQHAEIRAAIDSYENDFANLALQNPVAPPTDLKQKIWSQIQNDDTVTQSVSLNSSNKNNSWIKYLAAAAIVGLIVSLGMNLMYSKKNNAYVAENNQLKSQQEKLELQSNLLQSITSSSVKTIVLNGIPAHANNKATVYWDSASKAAYLILNNLPKPAPDKQYQLWALVKGKPIDAGLYDENNTAMIQKLKDVQSADMFAITLEPKGGSVSPTLSQMYVAGKLL